MVLTRSLSPWMVGVFFRFEGWRDASAADREKNRWTNDVSSNNLGNL